MEASSSNYRDTYRKSDTFLQNCVACTISTGSGYSQLSLIADPKTKKKTIVLRTRPNVLGFVVLFLEPYCPSLKIIPYLFDLLFVANRFVTSIHLLQTSLQARKLLWSSWRKTDSITLGTCPRCSTGHRDILDIYSPVVDIQSGSENMCSFTGVSKRLQMAP